MSDEITFKGIKWTFNEHVPVDTIGITNAQYWKLSSSETISFSSGPISWFTTEQPEDDVEDVVD